MLAFIALGREYYPMRYESSDPAYNASQESKCWEMFHSELKTPYCEGDLDHEGNHRGRAFEWSVESKADPQIAERFLGLWRRIPNYPKGIVLNDDGSVTMTIGAFDASVRFIGLGRDPHSD